MRNQMRKRITSEEIAMTIRYKHYFFLLLFLPVLLSCNRNRLKVDTSDIKAEVEVVRFDRELFSISSGDTLEYLKELRNDYPGFFDLYTYKVIHAGGIQDDFFPGVMREFLTDTMIRNVKVRVEEVFGNFEKTEQALIQAFKYYRYHFPEKELPEIFTVISGFNQSVFTAEEIVGVSLDKYLGRDAKYYRQLSNVPLYKIKNMHPGKVVPDIVYAWGLTEFDATEATTTLLDHMVHQGKLLYFTDALLPEEPDTLKIGYTDEELQWCHNNEPQMWNYLIEKKLLYSNNRMDIVRYTNDGPTTTGFPRESPGKTGTWLGWQIVRQYMKKFPGVTLAELMENSDYQGILNESGYYPE